MQKREGEKKESRRIFLKEIAKVPRTAQIFIDNYSLRDDETNRNIVELNRLLKLQNMDKTNINKKIDDFLVDLEERKKNQIAELERIPVVIIEGDDTNIIREQIKRNLQNEPNIETDDNILAYKKIIEKKPIDLSNQTVTENYNVFKQFKDRILEKKQEVMYRIKPMTAGEFLNEKPKKICVNKNDNHYETSKDAKLKTPASIQGLSKFLKEDPIEIRKILEQQSLLNNEILSNFNKLSYRNNKGKVMLI